MVALAEETEDELKGLVLVVAAVENILLSPEKNGGWVRSAGNISGDETWPGEGVVKSCRS